MEVATNTPEAEPDKPTPEQPTATPEPVRTFDRRAIITQIVETLVLPLHAQLAAEASALDDAVDRFAETPNTETLAAAQERWRAVAEVWASIEPLSMRFSLLTRSYIKKWPLNDIHLERFIAEEEIIDEAFILAAKSSTRGLATIEYLLFDPTKTDEELVATLTATPTRMAYLAGLTENLAVITDELNSMWLPEGGNQAQALIDADYEASNVQGAISLLFNQLLIVYEEVMHQKIGNPLRGGFTGEALPNAVESPYANHSLPLLTANLRTIYALLDRGFLPYLEFMQDGDTELSSTIRDQFEYILVTLDAIEAPLQRAVLDNPDAVTVVRTKMKLLLFFLKVDLANQMNLTVTFTDRDGD